MNRLALCGLLVALACNAGAVLGTPDPVPAATVLLPYFEADLDDMLGMTTLIAVGNAGLLPATVHVTVWTNAAVPTSAFDVAIPGFGIRTFNVRDWFTFGLPDGSTPEELASLAAAHTGQPDPVTGQCSGISYGDNVARGYVLFDVVTREGAGFPTDAGYFAPGPDRVASNENILWGDYIYVDSANNFAQSELLVHIEAGDDPLVTMDGKTTFYGRYVGGSAEDNREPLPAIWGMGYDLRGDSETEVIYWRDTKTAETPFVCGVAPSIFPLEISDEVVFDEQSNASGDIMVPLVEACGRVPLSAAGLPFEFGWLYENLNVITPGLFDVESQAFVTVVRSSEGRFSTAATGVVFR